MIYQVKITLFANKAAKKLNPAIKKAIKATLKELSKNPHLGKPLQKELNGFWTHKVLRYRVIFKIDTQKKMIVMWGIGHRTDVYETLGEYLLSLTE